MFKIILSEKTIKNKRKLWLESKVFLYKKDFNFLFNKMAQKVNKLHRGKKRIYIVTFESNVNNNLIYKLNYLK